jgi:subtilisin family serine protease
MDHAPGILNAPFAWKRLGGVDVAGQGMRIAIIDTGIQVDHPAFQDASLTVPSGFPRGNRDTDLNGTNNKIIVSRSYEDMAGFLVPNTRDVIGHGSAVAMAAAGIRHQSPIGEISGIAPKAFLGAYKIFGGTGAGSTRTSAILRAIDDAVNDEMDVINMSIGIAPAFSSEADPFFRAIENASARGVIVVHSAGNNGPKPGTSESPGVAPSVINVGSIPNDRIFASTVTAGDSLLLAIPAETFASRKPVRGILADVARFDPSGQACGALPATSLEGRIALILRGPEGSNCTFELKLNNAQRAGAVAGIIFTDHRPVSLWTAGNAALPGLMIRNSDGLALRDALAGNPNLEVRLRFDDSAVPLANNEVSSFSARGPGVANVIYPDVLAVGELVYTASESTDPRGEVYDASGYKVRDGTSFSAPMAAGAAALVKSAKPGLSARHYKSLLVNTANTLVLADGQIAPIQSTGAGFVDIDRALRATAVANPVSLSFGAAGASADITRDLTITNIGSSPDIFTIGVTPFPNSPAPQFANNTVTLPPGASTTIAVRWNISQLDPGEYQGFLIVQGTQTDVDLRIPYWYAVTSPIPRSITTYTLPTSPRAGSQVEINIRVNDASGVALLNSAPTVTSESGGGSATSVFPDLDFPGTWLLQLRLGTTPGPNVFVIQAGEVTQRLTISSIR